MRRLGLLVALMLAGCAGPAPITTHGQTTDPARSAEPTSSASSPSPSESPNESRGLIGSDLGEAVEVADIRAHLVELQRIANANGGNRATGTTGFGASVDYVAERLTAAGYEVARQAFIVGDVRSVNLVVERVGSPNDVIMLGAHLDSVEAGSGINDNGSGVATLLVVAERLAELPTPERTVRFAFWGAEEGGPHGSREYVHSLPAAELARIRAYLNFDMLASPNPIRFVYAEGGAAPGSDALTALFTSYFEAEGLSWAPIDLEGDSDHGPFTDAGIPTGGLFSGGIEPNTDAQAAAFGGSAGVPSDACSHQACDTIDNVNDAMLAEMAAAVAHALATLAMLDS